MPSPRCEDVMTRNPSCCASSNTLLDAINIMKELNVGFVPVCAADNRLVGVITDRDIALCLSDNSRPGDIRVNEVMSRDPVTVRPNDDLFACARVMEEHQIRRVPVVDDNNRLLGIIATADVARAAARGRRDVESEIPSIIESISQPT